VLVQQFVDRKSVQLSFYLRSFWQNEIPHSELRIFIWDVLEEWTQVSDTNLQMYSQKERLFWHLIYQAAYWEPFELLDQDQIQPQLESCLYFMESGTLCPLDIVGIRP